MNPDHARRLIATLSGLDAEHWLDRLLARKGALPPELLP
jgi:hypothetical protein